MGQKTIKERIGSGTRLCAGAIAMLVAIAVLFTEETRLSAFHPLKTSALVVVRLTPDQVDPSNEGKLVYICGATTIGEPIFDVDFNISARAIRMKRRVEMLQWDKRNPKTGNGEAAGAVYEKIWSDQLVDPAGVASSAAGGSPRHMPGDHKTFEATRVSVGGFELSSLLVAQLSEFSPLQINEDTRLGRLKRETEGYYRGKNQDDPQVGDLHVFYQVIEPGLVSIVARQKGNMLVVARNEANQIIGNIQMGNHTPQALCNATSAPDNARAWIIRLCGFLVFWLSFRVIPKRFPAWSKPLGLAWTATLITLAIPWGPTRPLLVLALLVAACLPLVLGLYQHSK